jgi:hypothetical protein
LHAGGFELLGAKHDVLAYAREADGRRFVVLVNFARERRSWVLSQSARPVLSSDPGRSDEPLDGEVRLSPHEAIVLRA